jgi:hypothetical protein
MIKKAKNKYALKVGMVLERDFYGRRNRLEVIAEGGLMKFKIDNRIFTSLTQAARYVCGDDTRSISGPQFWRAPKA